MQTEQIPAKSVNTDLCSPNDARLVFQHVQRNQIRIDVVLELHQFNNNLHTVEIMDANTDHGVRDIQMNIQEISYPRSSYKNKTRWGYRVVFHAVQFVLICVASLPTMFFLYHIHESDHHQGLTKTSVIPELDKLDRFDNNNTNSSRDISDCNTPLVYDNVTNECYVPCEWTTMSKHTHSFYYALMAIGLWLPLFATIFILITWSKIQSLRSFPHVIRFYIIMSCVLLACCKMIPLRAGLKRSFCTEMNRWSPTGLKSLLITIQGGSCHYFTLCLSFWSTCFILNTYLVVVKGTRKLFESSTVIHLAQSMACWVGPAVFVAICIYTKYPSPAYKIAFVDFMTASPCGEMLNYLSVTLPMQITLGISLCLLWSITWCIRRSRKDNTRHAIRADKDTQAMQRIERQFTVMTVTILLVVGVMMTVKTVNDYQLDRLILLAHDYFTCLKHTRHCQEPDLMTPLYAALVVSPGFLCMLFFFLLFMNKDCREIWTSCFGKIRRLDDLTKPRTETNRSRCSSTLTFLGDRKLSDVLLRRDRLKSSSTPDLACAVKPSPLTLKKKSHLSPLVLDNRPRSSSTPVIFSVGNNNDFNKLGSSYLTTTPQSIHHSRASPIPQRFKVEIKVLSDSEKKRLTQVNQSDKIIFDKNVSLPGTPDDPGNYNTRL